MSIVVRFKPTGMRREQYETVRQGLEAAGEWPADGVQLHVCFGSEGDLMVSEIWDSREQFEAFGERLRPAIQGAGIQMSGEPEVFEVRQHEADSGRKNGELRAILKTRRRFRNRARRTPARKRRRQMFRIANPVTVPLRVRIVRVGEVAGRPSPRWPGGRALHHHCSTPATTWRVASGYSARILRLRSP